MNAIGEVRGKGQFLSQASARNITISDKDASFSDFEDDPSEVLTLVECQNRDWLCHLYSTSLMLEKYGLFERVAALWYDKLLTQPDEIQYLVTQTAKSIRRMHSLSHSCWGCGMLRLAAVAGLLYLADLYFQIAPQLSRPSKSRGLWSQTAFGFGSGAFVLQTL